MKELLQRQNLYMHLTSARHYMVFFKEQQSTQQINWNNFILTNFACYLFKNTI